MPIDWVPLWSLSRGETRYLPAALCYFGHPDVEQHFYCTGEANGCAAGNVIEEAVLQAFFEIVERDSSAIWWYNQIRRPLVDLGSFDDPFLTRVQERYVRLGREFWAIDITSDLGITVIAAVSPRLDGPPADILIGFGAHFDARVALHRAVTEMNQFLPAVSGRRPDGKTNYVWPDPPTIRFWSVETLESQPQLRPDPAGAIRRCSDFPSLGSGDLRTDLDTCLRIADEKGLEVLVLDQSRPDIELAIVRVVVPHMRQVWRRLGPGRLYDVPVELGWLSKPRAEADMNPTTIFF